MAQNRWFTTEVTMAGPNEGAIAIRLTDTGGKFTETFFRGHESRQREMLAVALTALSTGAKADAMFVSDDEVPPPDSRIELLYLRKPPTT